MAETDASRDRTRLRLAMDISRLSIWDMDVRTRSVVWDERGTEIIGLAARPDFRFEDWLRCVHPDDRGDLDGAVQNAIDDPSARDLEVEFRFCRSDGGSRYLCERMMIQRDAQGQATALLGVFSDITDRRRAERYTQKLLADLQHRTKNMVAVIRSMAARTREKSIDLDDFAAHFEGRLGVFARTHGTLARTVGGQASLEEIIREELRQVASPDAENWSIEGAPVALRQQTAEPLGLAIHELVTNAVKFGPLSGSGGFIDVSWEVQETPARRLDLNWVETNPVDVPAASSGGFGMDMLERALPYQLNAETRVTFEPRGLTCRIVLPLDPASS